MKGLLLFPWWSFHCSSAIVIRSRLRRHYRHQLIKVIAFKSHVHSLDVQLNIFRLQSRSRSSRSIIWNIKALPYRRPRICLGRRSQGLHNCAVGTVFPTLQKSMVLFHAWKLPSLNDLWQTVMLLGIAFPHNTPPIIPDLASEHPESHIFDYPNDRIWRVTQPSCIFLESPRPPQSSRSLPTFLRAEMALRAPFKHDICETDGHYGT